MAVCADAVCKSLEWKGDRSCWRQGHMCQDQADMLPRSLDTGARLPGLLCKFLTGGMDAMARNGSSCFENHKPALLLPKGPVIPGVGTASPLAITTTMLGNFTRKTTCGLLWLQVLLLGTTGSVMHMPIWTKSGLDCSWPVCLGRFLLQQMVIIFYQTLQRVRHLLKDTCSLHDNNVHPSLA